MQKKLCTKDREISNMSTVEIQHTVVRMKVKSVPKAIRRFEFVGYNADDS